MSPVKKTVDEWLNDIKYDGDEGYVPSEFALEFVSFIKLVNGERGEENKTPVIHYRMLDNIAGQKQNTANMCSRGLAKTTIMAEYLFLYIAVYGAIPGFGKVDYSLYVSDSIENGVKKMRLRLERRCQHSEFLRKYLAESKFTDIRWYFRNVQGKEFVVTGHGAKALSLDSILYTEDGTTTIEDCKIGDKIFGPDGTLAPITAKSEIFYKPMFQLELDDGRTLDVSEDHINSVLKYGVPQNLSTLDLLKSPLFRLKANGTKSYTFQIENTSALQYKTKHYPIDPYTLGLLLGDGSIKADGSNALHGHTDDIQYYKTQIPYEFGSEYVDRRNTNVVTLAIKKLSQGMRDIGIAGNSCGNKYIPKSYLYGAIPQRIALLQGLIDTDGTVSPEGKVSFCSKSKQLCLDVMQLVRSLGGRSKFWQLSVIEGQEYHQIGIWVNLNCTRLPRKAIREKFNKSTKSAIVGIHRIANVPSQCIAIDSDSHQFLANDYVRTHNTGVRGTVELNTRPQLAVLDDLLGDEDAKSPTVIENVENTVYSAIDYALHPNKRKVIWSGTPFNAKDPLYKAIESGVWYVNVYPVCETFPCSREDFRGAWPDRFNYDYVNNQYLKSKGAGKLDSFNQELMLRIMSDEDRLIDDADLVWYKRRNVLSKKGAYNFYVTTDLATSDKQHADFSVINVWALNNNGDWLWVDGFCKRALMDESIDNLFRLVQEYMPQEVGIETSGQQGGFISWIQNEMGNRNIYFTLSKGKNSKSIGIRPTKDKMSRFQQNAVPLFKAKKIWLPEELRDSAELMELLNEISLATLKGFKSKHDDQLDTISMLAELNAWKPSEVSTHEIEPEVPMKGMWAEDDFAPNKDSSYFV